MGVKRSGWHSKTTKRQAKPTREPTAMQLRAELESALERRENKERGDRGLPPLAPGRKRGWRAQRFTVAPPDSIH